jgi:hypothetical protein
MFDPHLDRFTHKFHIRISEAQKRRQVFFLLLEVANSCKQFLIDHSRDLWFYSQIHNQLFWKLSYKHCLINNYMIDSLSKGYI